MLDQAHIGTLPAVAPSVTSARVPPPGWMEAAETFHASAPRVGVIALDAMLVLVAVSAAGNNASVSLLAAAAFLAGAWVSHLYRRRTTIESQGLGWYIQLLPVSVLVLLGALALTDGPHPGRWLVSAAAAAAVLVASRGIAWVIVSKGRRRELGLRPAIAVGTYDRLRQLQRRVSGFPECGLRIAATVEVDTPSATDRARAWAMLQRGEIDQILIADAGEQTLLEDWAAADPAPGADIDCALVLPVGSGPRPAAAHIGDLGVVPLGRLTPRRHRMWSKRVLDIVVAGSLIVLLAPVFAIVALAVWMYDRGPVFYRQWRVGLDGRQFRIWKFRSMVPDADTHTEDLLHANVANGLLFKVPDDPRVTPVGSLIRRLSIDELPQFFNVVTGDMSLVGPRPLPVDPDEFNGSARRRHHVRPGITGLWQVAGGHVVDYDDMIKLDLAYIDGWSLRQDIALLLMTVPAVLVRRSAY
jgi:exopolysaccharide biosynthesis polyprenyl glycosylphosphotransferase